MSSLTYRDTPVPDSVLEFVGEGIGFIASNCDGAKEVDGVGFSKAHAGFGKMLAMLPATIVEQDQEVFEASADLLMAYPRQVQAFAGIDLDQHPDWKWLKEHGAGGNSYTNLPEGRMVLSENPDSPIGYNVSVFLRNKRQLEYLDQLGRIGEAVGAYEHDDGHRFVFTEPEQLPVLMALIESRLADVLPPEDLEHIPVLCDRLKAAVGRGDLPLQCEPGQGVQDPIVVAPDFDALKSGRVVMTLDTPYDPHVVSVARSSGGSWNRKAKTWEFKAKDEAGLLKSLDGLEAALGGRLALLSASDWDHALNETRAFDELVLPGFDETDDAMARLVGPYTEMFVLAREQAGAAAEAAEAAGEDPAAPPKDGPRARLVTGHQGKIMGRVHLPYDYRDLKDELKPLGARFDWDVKEWILQVNDQNLEELKALPIHWETPLDEFFAEREVPPFGYLELRGDHQIRLDAPYHPGLVDFIRNEIARVDKAFDGATKTWTFRASTPEVVERVKELMGEFRLKLRYPGEESMSDADANRELDEMSAALTRRLDSSYVADSSYHVDGIKLDLFPFQRAGVGYIKDFGNTLVADDCGLGKTPQAIAGLIDHEAFPALVVCPSIARLNWEGEFQKFTDQVPADQIAVLGIGSPAQKRYNLEKAKTAKVVIVNYDILSKHAEELVQIPFKGGVMDESHYAKTPDAKRTQASKKVMAGENMKLKLLLSATPYMNRPSELIPQLEILDKLEAVGGAGYLKSMDHAGPEALEQMNRRLRATCMLRREKRAVWDEMPDVLVSNVPCTPSKAYLDAEAELAHRIIDQALNTADAKMLSSLPSRIENGDDVWATWVSRHGASSFGDRQSAHFEEIARLRHQLGQEKAGSVVEWLKNFRDSTPKEEKIVLFAYHKDVQEALYEGAKKLGMNPAWIGDQEAKFRKAEENRFQKGDARVCIATMKAARENITLTAGSHCMFAEFDYSGGVMIQCRDRLIRISQQAATVNVNFAMMRDSLDVNMVENIQEKMAKITKGLGDGHAQDGLSAEGASGALEMLVSRYEDYLLEQLPAAIARAEELSARMNGTRPGVRPAPSAPAEAEKPAAIKADEPDDGEIPAALRALSQGDTPQEGTPDEKPSPVTPTKTKTPSPESETPRDQETPPVRPGSTLDFGF